MDSETLTLIMVWAIGVVAFFVLWAILTKIVQRINEQKKGKKDNLCDVDDKEEKASYH